MPPHQQGIGRGGCHRRGLSGLALYQVRDGGRVVEALMPIMKAFEAGKAPIPAFTPAQLRGVLEDDQALACASSCSASNVVKRKLRCAGECGMVILTTSPYEWRAL
jgi:hypothetical protein